MSKTGLPDSLVSELKAHHQQDFLTLLEGLNQPVPASLVEQLQEIDLSLISRLFQKKQQPEKGEDSPQAKAARASELESVVRQPRGPSDQEQWRAAHAKGLELLKAGKVAAVLVAGGQGTRLGFDHPKGMFPIGPVSGATLFQIFFEQLKARRQQAGVVIPYFIMTSDATDGPTANFLNEHNYFGVDPDTVKLFKQGTMPAVDDQTGALLLGEDLGLVRSPDGHGGILNAMSKSGIFDQLKASGIEYLYYHQVDNPTAIICEPALIGFHALKKSEATTKVAAKRSADEKMGVLACVDGKTEIIEYSDMPTEVAEQRDAQGQLKYWAGNMAIHVFSVDFLVQITHGEHQLPYHVAHKKVPHVNEGGKLVSPSAPNAFKFERFIFDALPMAREALVVEADRAREFNPVKNAEGQDSPQTSREALLALHRLWLEEAGVTVPEGCAVEISPLFAVDADAVRLKAASISISGSEVYLR